MADEQKVEEERKLKINIKSTKHKDSVEVPFDCTVKQVRQLKLILTVHGKYVAATCIFMYS